MQHDYADLQLDEQLDFQDHYWRAQRIGWCLLLVLPICGLAGLLGPGPLSSATASAPGGFEARYSRFARYQTPHYIEVSLATADEPNVWLSQDFMSAAAVTAISPEPVEAVIDDDGVTYRFNVGAGSATPTPVRFELIPARPGLVRGALGPAQGRATTVWQLVYP